MGKNTRTHTHWHTHTSSNIEFWIEIKRKATVGYYARDLYQHEFMDEFKGTGTGTSTHTPCISHFWGSLLIL